MNRQVVLFVINDSS